MLEIRRKNTRTLQLWTSPLLLPSSISDQIRSLPPPPGIPHGRKQQTKQATYYAQKERSPFSSVVFVVQQSMKLYHVSSMCVVHPTSEMKKTSR